MNIKQKIFIVNLILLFLSSLQAQNERIDYMITYKDSLWYKTNYNYNSENQIINTTTAISTDKNNWKNYTYSTTSYIDGAVSEVYYYSWENNKWNLTESQNYKYASNKLTTYIRSVGAHQEIIDYNNQDTTQIITHKFLHNDTLQYTNKTTKKFENNKIVYTKIASITPKNDTSFAQYTTFEYYNNKTIATSYELIENKYIPYFQSEQLLNDSNILYEIQKKYINNQWAYNAKQVYTYSNGKLNEITYQYWNNNSWISTFKRQYTYNNNKTIQSCDIYELIYKEWVLVYQILYNYQEPQNIKFSNIQQTFWSETKQEYNDYISLYGNNKHPFVYCNMAEFSYSNITVNIPIDVSPIQIYPNPTTSGIVFINTNLPILDIKIYDLNGILQYQTSATDHLNLSNLNNGIYIIYITTNENRYTFKQIINNY